MAQRGNQGGKWVWPSLEQASRIANIANIFFITSLIVGIVSTILIVWMANEKERYWDIARIDSRQKIEALQLDVAKANQAAEADRLARVRIEERLANRSLNSEQQTELAKELIAFGGLLGGAKQDVAVFSFPSTTFERESLVRQLAAVFQVAGWKVNYYPVTYGLPISAISGVGILTTRLDRSVKLGSIISAHLNKSGIKAGIIDGFFAPGCEEQPRTEEYLAREPRCSAISVFIGDKT